MKISMLSRKDTWALAWLFSTVALLFSPAWLSLRTFFWGDLTYLHTAWKGLPAELLTRGQIPLWNPYNYLGMPLAANLQSGVFFPGSLAFYFFPFPWAVKIYLLAHFFAAGLFAFLWLRSLGFTRCAAVASSLVMALGGVFLSHLPFLNNIGCLAFLPALMLFSGSTIPLALTMAVMFLDGYPTIWAGAIVSAWLVSLLTHCEQGGLGPAAAHTMIFLKAGLLALGLSGCLLLPGVELAKLSERTKGLAPAIKTLYSFSLSDWRQFIGPLLTAPGQFSPQIYWWKTCYMGMCGFVCALVGAWRISGRLRYGLLAYAAITLFLTLGNNHPYSLWAWNNLALLGFIRYPGNLLYLLIPPILLWTAAGLNGRRWAAVICAVISAELTVYGMAAQPSVRHSAFSEKGVLVRYLQQELDGHRYLISPRALEWHRGAGRDFEGAFLDWKQRLYGVTNAVYHLQAIGNFGEPLIPRNAYAFMDMLYSASGLDAVAPFLPWADAVLLMTKDSFSSGPFRYAGEKLWHLYRLPDPSFRARYWERKLPLDFSAWTQDGGPPSLKTSTPWEFQAPRPDIFIVEGTASRPGWVSAAQIFFPGWKVWLNGERVPMEPAMGAFLQVAVPSGRSRLLFRYEPRSWMLGVLLTLLCLGGVAAWGYLELYRL